MASPRQAVVVIHGVGDQRPSDTLRGFVLSVLHELKRRKSGDADDEEPRFYNRVDRLSELFELRHIVAPSTRRRPVTHFYELYWAHEMYETTWSQVLRWFRRLLFRRSQLPPRLRWVWNLAALALLAAVPVGYGVSQLAGDLPGVVVWLAQTVAVALAGRYGLKYAGDAARYLQPDPDNVDARQRIRRAGVELLRRLHDAEHGYERIVVVGHSLGSVIAYDVLRQLWVEMHRSHGRPYDASREALDAMDEHLEADRGEGWSRELRKRQRELFVEQRSLGAAWLVSDLVTAGSPLAHASYLITRGEDELREHVRERALPSCPPERDEGSVRSHVDEHYEVEVPGDDGDDREVVKRTLAVPHESALFAVTRWTNLYYPGDFIGGPIGEPLGEGVYNREVVAKKARCWSKLPATHTHYWRAEPPWAAEGEKEAEAVRLLVDAMGLEARPWLTRIRKRRRERRVGRRRG